MITAFFALFLLITFELASGDIFTPFMDSTSALDIQFVRPVITNVLRRQRRDIKSNVFYESKSKLKIVRVGDWILELNAEHNLVLPSGFRSQWIYENETVDNKVVECEYKSGVVRGAEGSSLAAVTLCGSEIMGYFNVGPGTYFVEPFNASHDYHVLFRSADTLYDHFFR